MFVCGTVSRCVCLCVFVVKNLKVCLCVFMVEFKDVFVY